MKEIRVKDAPKAIARGQNFKAADLVGMPWEVDSPLHPIARRIELMPENERTLLLQAMEQMKGPSTQGLRYLVSSYGVPIAWVTHDGVLHRTQRRHSDATAKHIELAVIGLQDLLGK